MNIEDEVLKKLRQLPDEQKAKVLSYVESLELTSAYPGVAALGHNEYRTERRGGASARVRQHTSLAASATGEDAAVRYGHGLMSVRARSAAANDMPACSGGAGRESRAYPASPWTPIRRHVRTVVLILDGDDDRRVMTDQDRVAV